MDRLDELMGKGSIDKIGQHHRKEVDAAPFKSKKRSYHSSALNRAQRIKNTITGKSHIGPPKRSDTLEINKIVRKRQMTFKEDVNKRLGQTGRKKLSTFERLQRKTRNYLINRDNLIARRIDAGHDPHEIAKDLNLHPAIVTAVAGTHRGRNLAKEETQINEISSETKRNYADKARKDFDDQAEKRWKVGASDKDKSEGIRKMGNRAKGIDKTRNEETVTEDKKIISVKGSTSGNRYELHAHNQGHPSEWHGIIKTHQGGHSLKNEFGGFPPLNVGSPKHVASKWKAIKETQLDEVSKEKLGSYVKGATEFKKAVDKDTKTWAKAENNDRLIDGQRATDWADENNVGNRREKMYRPNTPGKSRFDYLKDAKKKLKESQDNAFAKLAKKITNKSLTLWLKAHQTPTFGGIQDKARGTEQK